MSLIRVILDQMMPVHSTPGLMSQGWFGATPTSIAATIAGSAKDTTARMETKRRHASEVHDKNLKIVQGLEVKLGINVRWVPGSVEWDRAVKLISTREYQRALDALEGLIVARMFELTKMNMSQTGQSSNVSLIE
jgi:hypothetical protein